MKRLTISLLALFYISLLIFESAAKLDQSEADKMAGKLRTAQTPNDSLKILYDVFDLSNNTNRDKVGMQILDIASRTGDKAAILDMLNQLSSRVDDAEGLSQLIKISSELPDNSDKKSIEVVLKVNEFDKEAAKISDSERNQRLLNYVKVARVEKDDIYEEILDIYRTLSYLGVSSQGPMYLTYLTQLENLVKQLPENEYAIKNLFYTTSAIYYTRRRNYEKAIEANRELLKILNDLESQYQKAGRSHSNFDYFYYTLYRRLLQNYKGLTPEEVQNYYDKCVQLAEKNEDVKEIFGKRGITKSYYYMATKQYALALPEIRKALEEPDISNFRRRELTGMLATALHETGDKAGELDALEKYVIMIEEERKERQDDAMREMALRTEVNHITAIERAEQEKQRQENIRMRKVSITLVYFLAAILIFVFRGYFVMKKKMKILEEKNKNLNHNIENIFSDGMPSGTSDLRKNKNRLKG